MLYASLGASRDQSCRGCVGADGGIPPFFGTGMVGEWRLGGVYGVLDAPKMMNITLQSPESAPNRADTPAAR